MPNATPSPIRILVFDGSLRKDSLNRRLASMAAECVQNFGGIADRATIADFDCPSYNHDVETTSGVPAGARALRERLTTADAFIIASPEYNASMSGVLKNVIDWTSRIRPQPFNGKQGFLLSASPSMGGGNRGLWSLRIPLEHLGARVYPDMFSLAQAHEAFGPNGRLLSDVLHKRFDDLLRSFMDLVEAAKHYPCLKKLWVEFPGERPETAIDRVEVADTEA